MVAMAKKKPESEAPIEWPPTLKALRTHYDLEQTEAAERLGVPVATWRNWEQGRRGVNAMVAKLIRLTFRDYFQK